MRVTVLGAHGRTGRLVVEESLRRGHPVTALVRDPGRLAVADQRVRVVAGDVRDPAAVRGAVEGSDAVISALGPSGKDRTLHRELAPALIAAMSAAGVRRFVGISGAGVDAPDDAKGARDRVASRLMHVFGAAMVADKEAERAAWAASTLDWTLVRPPRLVDGPATGRVLSDAVRTSGSMRISRADLARFVVDQLTDPSYVGAAPVVAAATRRSRSRPGGPPG